MSLSKGWINKIAHAIEQDTDIEVVAVNTSLNGRTTRQALEHMPHEVQSHNPDILVVQYGMNDCNYWVTDKGMPRVSKEAFKANLHEIIARGFRAGAKNVVLNTNHPTLRDTENFPNADICYQQSNEEYNEIVRGVAKEYKGKVVLIDIEKHIKDNFNRDEFEDLLLPDFLHLSKKGHDIYFQIVYPVIKNVIQNV